MRANSRDKSETQALQRERQARRHAEAALQRSEAMFRALTDATAAAVWMCDARGEITDPCPSWARFTGQTFAEYQGRGWLKAVHPDDQEAAARAWAEAVDRQIPYQVVYQLRRHDGAYRLTQARGALVRDGDGVALEWIGANFDITEQERASAELRDRDERLRAALAGSGAGTFRWDMVSNELDWDAELDRAFGLPPGETTRSLDAFIERVHPDDRPLVIAACNRCATEGVDFEETFRIICPDGSIRWIFDRGRTYHDDAGRPAYMTGACLDVTERQASTARLRASEERLRAAQEAGEVGTFEWFPETGLVVASEQYRRLWGFSSETPLKAEQLVGLVHPEDRSRSGPANLHRLDSALDYVEYRIRRADTGEQRWLARRGQMLPGSAGAGPRMVGAVYDVTAKRLAEQRLQEVLESVTDGFIGLDDGWRITLMNGAARHHFRTGDVGVVGAPFGEVFPDLAGSPIEAALQQAMNDGQPVTIEVASVRRPGHFIELRIAPKAGGGIAIACTDVTERHHAERHRELLVNELNHRVKNTLAIVQATAYQTLRRGVVSDAVRESFEGRLGVLAGAHDILTQRNWETAYLHELIEAALAPFIRDRGGQVVVEGPELQLPARTAVSFALAMHELATNAAKYGALSTEQGRVSVVWWLEGGPHEPHLKLRWREHGGPPVVAPKQRGFGSRMIEMALANELRGDVKLTFHAAGVSCLIDAPLGHLEELVGQPLDL